jgi:hypothetical protein
MYILFVDIANRDYINGSPASCILSAPPSTKFHINEAFLYLWIK